MIASRQKELSCAQPKCFLLCFTANRFGPCPNNNKRKLWQHCNCKASYSYTSQPLCAGGFPHRGSRKGASASFHCPTHSQKPFYSLHRRIIIARVKYVSIGIAYWIIRIFIKRIERTKNRIFWNKVQQVFSAAINF